MTRLLLDISAGDSTFVTQFFLLNHMIVDDFLCGEPFYKNPRHGPTRWRRVHKGKAEYDDFVIEDHMLDIVTLNALDSQPPSHSIIKEVERCLRPGGVFISAHPFGIHFTMNSFELIPGGVYGFVRSHQPYFTKYEAQVGVPKVGVIRYPASPIIKHRLDVTSAHRSVSSQSDMLKEYQGACTMPTVRMWHRR